MCVQLGSFCRGLASDVLYPRAIHDRSGPGYAGFTIIFQHTFYRFDAICGRLRRVCIHIMRHTNVPCTTRDVEVNRSGSLCFSSKPEPRDTTPVSRYRVPTTRS